MPALSDDIRLRHMLDAARKALAFIEGRARADLDREEMLALAVVRLLEVVGEAARNVSPATRDQHPDVPWEPIAAARNRLLHGYYDVDLDIVWRILTEDLPPLVARLEAILESRESGPS